jgi:hypothetical protein
VKRASDIPPKILALDVCSGSKVLLLAIWLEQRKLNRSVNPCLSITRRELGDRANIPERTFYRLFGQLVRAGYIADEPVGIALGEKLFRGTTPPPVGPRPRWAREVAREVARLTRAAGRLHGSLAKLTEPGT